MDFKQKGYHVVKNFIEPEFLKFIQDYFAIRINAGDASLYDTQAPNSYSFYGDPLTETILQNSCEALSDIIGIKLLPTYSYARLYTTGDELKIHIDRPSCEISATLSLGIPEGDEINPILFSNNSDGSNPSEILLEPGDLCVYRGCNLYHWRPPVKSKWYLQSFFHFVKQDGKYKNLIYDERPYLGFKPIDNKTEEQ
jgi:hypothetical protein